MKPETIEQEALRKYPKEWRGTTASERVAHFDPNEQLRTGYIAGRSAQIEREKELQRKVDFFREATDKCREFVFGRNDIGHPNQPLWDAVHDKLIEQAKEIERLKKLVESQFFKYYDDDFQNDLWETFKAENNL